MPKKNKDPYTPIHNEVLEALAKINLSPYETRILMATWRKTYGFRDHESGERKKCDRISLSQYEEITGIDRRIVSRALSGLKKKGVIQREKYQKTGFSKDFMKKMGNMAQSPKISQSITKIRTSSGIESIAEIIKKRKHEK